MEDLNYPIWKKALIEGLRVLVGTFIAQMVLLLSIETIANALYTDLYSLLSCLYPFAWACVKTADIWNNLLALLVLPSMSAGIKAVMKWAREKYATYRNGVSDYDHWLYKLPI